MMRVQVTYLNRRALDWFAAAVVLAIGLVLLQPGQQVMATDALTLGEEQIGMIFVLVGNLRIMGLVINGHWRSGGSALIRVGASVLGATFWMMLGYASAIQAGQRGWVTFGLAIDLLFVVADWYCAVRAARDYIGYRQAMTKARTMQADASQKAVGDTALANASQ